MTCSLLRFRTAVTVVVQPAVSFRQFFRQFHRVILRVIHAAPGRLFRAFPQG